MRVKAVLALILNERVYTLPFQIPARSIQVGLTEPYIGYKKQHH